MDTLSIKTDSSFQVKDSDGNSLGGMSNINTTGTVTQVSEISLPISCKTFYGNGSFYDTPQKFVDAVWAYMNNGVPSDYWNGNVNAVTMAYVLEWDGTGNYTYVSRPVVMKLWKVTSSQQPEGFYTKMSFYYADEVDTSSLAYTKTFGSELPWVFNNAFTTDVTSIADLYAIPKTKYLQDISFDGGSIMHKEVPFANGGSWGDAFKSSMTIDRRSTLVVTILKCTNTNQ